MATRRLRIVKYRGSSHGTNEYPFLIDEQGFSVLPITSLGLDHRVSSDRISTGIPRLDAMMGGEGFYRGSSILVSGTAGTGKSSLAAAFVDAACRRGERALYFAFEESSNQIIRNMRSLGIDLEPWVKKGLLRFAAARPTLFGLEMHLVTIHKAIEEFKPTAVVVDPISNLMTSAGILEVKAMLTRLIDYLKGKQITAFCTDLTTAAMDLEQTEVGISSLMDAWLLLKAIEEKGERNRGLYILKSRGMAHSNQIREFILSDRGIQLLDVYTGPGGALTGSARSAQEAQDKAESARRSLEIERKQREVERKEKIVEAQIAALRGEFEAEREELLRIVEQDKIEEDMLSEQILKIARMRKADPVEVGTKAGNPGEKDEE
jgi:circadian clock protein KaiC